MLTTHEAKNIIRTELQLRSLPFTRLSAKTVSFAGFGYGDCVFVCIHGWTPNPAWDALKSIAKQNGFRIESAS